jgi:outer membrane protein assembly complex protein YaeT
MKKRRLKLFFRILSAIAGLFVLALLFLLTPPAKDFAFKELRQYLRNRSGIDLEASGVRLNFFRGTASLENPVIRLVSAPDLPPIFRAARLYANAGIWDILKGYWIIEDLKLTEPQIHYYVGEKGQTNLPGSTSASAPAPDLLFIHAEASDGSFTFQDRRKGISLAVPRLQFSAKGDRRTFRHHISFNGDKDSVFEYGNHTVPIHSLNFSGILEKTALQIESARLDSASSRISVSGSLNSPSEPSIDLEFATDLDLEGIASILKLKEKVQGALAGKIHAAGGPRSIRISADLKGSNISAQDYQHTAFELEGRAEWLRDSGKLIVQALDIASPEGSLNAHAELYPGTKAETNSIEARIRNLNLFPIWKLMRPPFDLGSRTSGRISLQWKGPFNSSGMNGEAHLNLIASHAKPTRNLLPVSGKLDARIQPNRILGNLEPLVVFGTEVKGRFSLQSFRDIQGDFQGHAPDIEILTTELFQFLGIPDYLAGKQMSGPVRLNFRAAGRLKQPTIVAAVEAPRLQLGAQKNLKASAEATIQGAQIKFENTVVMQGASTVRMQGGIELGSPKTTLNLDARADRVPIQAILSMLNRDLPISGEIETELHVDGAMDDLTGYASVAGTGLALGPEPLGRLEMELKLSGNEIHCTRFRLQRDPLNPETGLLDAQFLYALDSGQFRFEADGKDLALKQLAMPGDIPVQGSIDLHASGAGTTDRPEIAVELESKSIGVREKSIGPVSLLASVDKERIWIEARAPLINLVSSIVIDNRAPYSFSGDLQINNPDLSLFAFRGMNGQPWIGSIEANLTGSGNLRDLSHTHLSARIQQLHLQTGKLEMRTRKPLELEYRDNALVILAPAVIASGDSTLEITGVFPIRKSATAGPLHITGQLNLGQATEFLPAPEGFAAAGNMHLDLALAGTPQGLRGSGTIRLNDGALQIPGIANPLTDVTLLAEVADGSLILHQADAVWAQGAVALTGEFPFGLLAKKKPGLFLETQEGPAQFSLDLRGIKPEATGMLPEGFGGLISMHASGKAAGADIRALNARVEFPVLELNFENIAFEQKEPSVILVQNGFASISRFSLIGPQTDIEAGGSVGLNADSPMNLRLSGIIDAALLTSLNRDLKAAGNLQVQAAIAGTRNAPEVTGYAEMNSGKWTLREPRIVADSLTMRLDLSSQMISIRNLSGTLNGGTINAEGTIGYRQGALRDFNIKAALQDVYLDFPEGLKSASSGNLTITSSENSIIVGGNVRVQESSYREPIEVGGRVMNYLKAQQVLEIGKEPHPFLDRIRLNIAVRTTTPLLVQNNIARVETGAVLRIVGTYYDPSIIGRITLNEGGEIVLNQREYYISRGAITLSNQSYIEPDLNIQAQTRVGAYDITLRLMGKPERLTTALSSEPALSEPDITSLLLTGKTLSENRGQEAQMVRTQALSLIAGQAGEEVAKEARQVLHLSTFRIDPGLIASESDPGARLTLGEDITRNFSLAYSMNLMNGGDQIWIAEYDFPKRLITQATRQQDNSYRFELRQHLQFGSSRIEGRPDRRSSRPSATRFEIGSIQFQGQTLLPEKDLRGKLKVRSGDKFDFQKIQKGLDRLHEYYADQGRLEADIRMQRETTEKTVDLNLKINPGPIVKFSFDGITMSRGMEENVEKAWKNGVFETERYEDAVLAIHRPLIHSGFLQAKVTHRAEMKDGVKRIHFDIAPGSRYSKISMRFPGASAIGEAELREALNRAGLTADVHADPEKVAEFLERYYHERGYLQALIELPKPELDAEAGTGRIFIPVHEGPLFLIGDLEFNGNSAFDYDQLWSVIPTSSGSSYDPKTLRDAVKALEDLYHSKGYNDVTVKFRVVKAAAEARAHLTFQITERRQSIIRDIAVVGYRRTSPDFVEQQLDFRTGDALDFAKIDETRKRLYATGVYASVDFQTEEIPESATDSGQKNIRVRIRLREIRPYSVQYGLFYDTDRGPGGLLEIQNMNFLGRASNVGVRLRYDSDLQEARLFYNQPFVRNIHAKMNASAFVQREIRSYFSSNRIGFSLFREKSLPGEFRFDYGYRYDHVRWEGLPPDPTLYQSSAPVARLIATLTRDTRDSFLDATRGEFSSHSLEFGPRFLGSETGFARYYGQYFRYVPLDKFFGMPTEDESGRRIRPKLLYAGALRLGLTGAFSGESLISPERFFAGGGTTMRGFEQDLLGPLVRQPDGSYRPRGGEALFLLNNEIRFPIVSILQGVGFVDIGNVYPALSDFDFSMRKSAGVGLRVKIKYIPLRFDYGFKLDRRPGESAGAFFFSIGQAF